MKTIIFDLDGTLVFFEPTIVRIANLEELTKLRETYMFALVTGCTREQLGRALTETELANLFPTENIVSMEDTKGDKMSGEPFRKIREHLLGDAVVIGDSDYDEVGSAKAGIPFVRVERCSTLEAQEKKLHACIEKAVEMLS